MSTGSMYLTSTLSALARRLPLHAGCISRMLPVCIAQAQIQTLSLHRTCSSASPAPSSSHLPGVGLQHSHTVSDAVSESGGKRMADAEAEAVLANLSPERAKKLKVLKLELDVLQEYGQKVPETIRPSWWIQLLDLETPSSRKKFYRYLRKIESHGKAKERQREKRKLIQAEKSEKPFLNLYLADNMRNSIHMYVRQQTMNTMYNSRLAHAMVFGPHLVVDLGLDGEMQPREQTNVVDQILMAHGYNKMNREPFDLVLTSARSENPIMRALHNACFHMPMERMMVTTTEKSFLELYPRERLVYLSPNAPEILREYNPDDVYVIGGFVDKSNPKPLTMAIAKRHNIRMAKFPLDKYLLWASGSKSLTIDQAIKIMLDLKNSGSWEIALQHVPRRKLVTR